MLGCADLCFYCVPAVSKGSATLPPDAECAGGFGFPPVQEGKQHHCGKDSPKKPVLECPSVRLTCRPCRPPPPPPAEARAEDKRL